MSAPEYKDWFNARVNDKLLNPTQVPQVYAGYTVVWPEGWTQEQADQWRRDNGIAKPEEA